MNSMSGQMKWVIVGSVNLLYMVLLWVLVPLIGPTVNVLCMVAPIIATIFFGLRVGVAALLASWSISVVLMLQIVGLDSGDPPMRAVPPFIASFILIYGASRIRAFVNQRKAAEQALRESEQRYRLIFEQSGQGILLLDAHGIVLDASPAIAEHAGVLPESMIGRPFLDSMTFVEERPASFAELLAQVQAESRDHELIVRHSSGEKQYLQLTISSADLREGSSKWVCLVKNVTEKREMLEMLQESKKMEAIGRLAGGVAHDLNNILNAIVGSAHAHRHEHSGCAYSFEDIDNIEAACNRGAQLTRSLLGFTRKSNMSKELLSLNTSIQSIMAVTSRTSLKHIQCESRLEPNLPYVEGDQHQIETALMNICLNAQDAMEAGGVLTITSYSDAEGVWVHIKDTGSGMEEAVRQRAFEPFFTTKPVGKGTGLGLAMAYGVMQSHGGRIHLQSAPEVGTTVTLWFPRANVNLKMHRFDDEPYVDADVSILAAHTILLVDDEPLVLRAGLRMLKTIGCTVVGAASGEEAIDIFRHRSDISLVLLDLIMPGMDGTTTLARLREIRPDIAVILVSGYTRNIERVSALQQARECEFIPKPYSPADLVKTLKKMSPC